MTDKPPADGPRTPKKRATAKVMKRARTVQLSMLPKMPAIEGLDLHAHYAPCEAVGGDFYDFVPVSPWEIGIVMGDVAGHGVDAALTMAMAKKTIQIHGKGRSSPRETLLATCDDLAPDLPGNSFITVFYGVLDLRSWKLTFASAGHTPPVLFNPARTPPLQSIPSKGVVMGGAFVQAMESVLVEQTLELCKGDTLFLYTDGLSEAPNAEDEQYGETRILQALGALQGGEAREVVASVITDLDRFVAGHPQQDDLTLLAMRIAGEPRAAARVPQTMRRRVWPTNLRPADSTFIGRAGELAQVQDWLLQEGSLVAITGGSGVGKSRLAVEAGRLLLEHLPGGVWLADCSDAHDHEQLAQAVAGALGMSLGGEDFLEAISATLEFRPPLLLILDNWDSVGRFARPVLEAWRAAAPRARFMVTSREALGVTGEQVLDLNPLATPTSTDEYEVLDDNDAASLFVERARESNPGFRVTSDSRPHIVSIVRELKGNPLAIELAAAQTRELTPVEIDDDLKRERETPPATGKAGDEGGAPDLADWAYRQLSEAEQSAFCQLCLMRGGFFLEAAQAVVRAAGRNAPDVTTLVQSLLDKQLLHSENTPYGVRFLLLPPIREFGSRRRAESGKRGQEDELVKRYVDYFADYAAGQEQRYPSRHAAEVLDRLELDLENIFAAQEYALAANRPEPAARALLGVTVLFALRSPMINRFERIRRTLAAVDKSAATTRIRLLVELAHARYFGEGWKEADRYLSEAIELCRRGRNESLLSRALADRGSVRINQGRLLEARADIEEALETAKSAKDAPAYQSAMVHVGWLDYQERRLAESLSSYEKAEPLIRRREDLPMLIECLNSKAIVLRALDRSGEALACAEETLQLLGKLRAPLGMAVQTGNIGVIHRTAERLDEALECFLQSESELREAGERHGLTRALAHIADLYLFMERYDASEPYARESLALAEKANDKLAAGRAHMILGHIALARKERFTALEHYESALGIERGTKRPVELAVATAFASLCRAEIGAAAKALEDIQATLAGVDALPLRQDTVRLFLTACKARAELLLDRRADAARTLKDALAQADKHAFGYYSSDVMVSNAWKLIDQLREAGLQDADVPQSIRVSCTRCGARIRGSRRRVEAQAACPGCQVSPFSYVID